MSSMGRLIERFGAGGMRTFSGVALAGSSLPDDVAPYLHEIGVPVRVAPYFSAAGVHEAVQLGTYASHNALTRPGAQLNSWVRLGDDGLAQLCVRPDGAVQAVFLDEVAPDMFVNSSIASFNAGLLALEEALALIASASGLQEALPAFRTLRDQLSESDSASFNDRENWWPRVLDDVRHTLNFPFSAAFEYLEASGEKTVVTEEASLGRPHPEEQIWQQLAAQGVRREQIQRVYSELEPCMMPGHYCAVKLQQLFPNARFTHSFDYGDTAASRESGIKELITYAAQRAGSQ